MVEEKVVDIANLKLTDDPLCNSEELRKLMLDVSYIIIMASKLL